jgi:4-amino-4-deoxy-L-arabinose transferase-like glycosyltransferase
MSKASYKTNRQYDFNDKNESEALRLFGLLVFFTFIIILRIAYYFLFDKSNLLNGDLIIYHKLALHFMNTGNFHIQNFDTLRPPAYPFFIACIYWLKLGIYGVIWFQIGISLISIYLIYRICLELFDKKTGLIAAILLSLSIDFAIFHYNLQPDGLFSCLILLSFLFIVQKRIILTFLILAISTYVKPIAIYLPIIYGIYLIVYQYKWQKILIGLSIFYLFIGIWCFRNYEVYGHFKFASVTGLNLYLVNIPKCESIKTNKSLDQVKIDFLKKNNVQGNLNNAYYTGFKENKKYVDSALIYIKNNKLLFAKTVTDNIYHFFTATIQWKFANELTREQVRDRKVLGIHTKHTLKYLTIYFVIFIYSAILLLIYYFGFIIGFVAFRKNKIVYLILAIILYFTFLTNLVIIGTCRHRMVILPFIIIIAAYGINKYHSKS